MRIKSKILKNICYTELVYQRINKKLNTKFSKKQIEDLILDILEKTEEKYFIEKGKNYYVRNLSNNILITINKNTFRVITCSQLT